MTDTDKSKETQDEETPIDPVYWYFQRERRERLAGSTSWTRDIQSIDKSKSFRIAGHVTLHANSVYLSVLIPSEASNDDFLEILGFVADEAEQLALAGPLGPGAPIKYQTFMKFEQFPNQDVTSDDARFTGRVFVYTQLKLSDEFVQNATKNLRDLGLFVVFRDADWFEFLDKLFGRRSVFLGHDSADKDDVVRELAHHLSGIELKVWYDEISLKPGSRLRKSLDDALESTDYFIPIVTDNWIANTRYAEYEFDAIMQRMITEKSVTILPVCVGVDPGKMKKKSRVLADTVAIVHDSGESIAQLARRIGNAIEPLMPNIGEPLPKKDLPKRPGIYGVGISVGPLDPVDRSDDDQDATKDV